MKKHILFISTFLFCAILFSGCGERKKEEKEIKDMTQEGVVTSQTSTLGIPGDSKDFKEKLVSGSYYVLHDGVYYPLFEYGNNTTDAPKDFVEPKRQLYFTTENEINIPTLFEGDELVYYSVDGLLDYLVWERYYDLGYTVGLLNLKTMTSGRVYLDLSKDDVVSIIPDSELYAMMDLNAEQILIDKIGGVSIDETLISDGLITSTQKSKTYDLEVYTGTHFKHYITTANTHAFKAYELFASIEYETLQEFLYRIEIPDYFVNGYYLLDGQGVVRIVRGDSYSEDTDFNEQLLYPSVDKSKWDYDENAYVAPRIYSTFEPLNKFKTNQEGKLGYVPEDASKTTEESNEFAEVILKEAVTKEIELYFPKGKTCTVQIKSSTGETTGDIRLVIGKSIRPLTYDRLEGIYTTTFKGKGEKGTLIVTGLTKTYDISLVNAEQYNGQDEVIESTSSETED